MCHERVSQESKGWCAGVMCSHPPLLRYGHNTQTSASYQDVLKLEVPVDNPLIVNEHKSSSDLLRPSKYFSGDIRIHGFCWSYSWVIKDMTLQVSFALFHYQDYSCGALFLEKGCAIKLYNVRMLQFSDEQNKQHAV